MADRIGPGASLAFALAASASACGNGDDLDPYARLDSSFEPIVILPARPHPSRPPPPAREAPGQDALGQGNDAAPEEAPPARDGASGSGDEGDGSTGSVGLDACVTPLGVSGSPRNLSEAISLMNSLPKPVSLECFLQALSRPLSLYSTRSALSLQPSPGERSPRTFIVNEPLVMSIVFDGAASDTLELGYRTTPLRSVKTELVFPLERDVTFDNLFDDVVSGDLTKCGACHTAEVMTLNSGIPVEVFESDIIAPFDIYEVDVASLRAERQSCDAALEPERCALLSAVFDFGEVSAAPQGIMF